MKKFFAVVTIIFFSNNLLAQVNIDSVLSKISYVPQDTINIREIVRQQIEQARLKAELSQITGKEIERENEEVSDSKSSLITMPASTIGKVTNNKLLDSLNSLSTNVKIFIAASLMILLALLYRRILLKVKKNLSSRFKKRIAMIREEAVIVKKDKKLSKTRKALRKIKLIDSVPNERIDLIARELSISKGEILLASKLKKFEYGK